MVSEVCRDQKLTSDVQTNPVCNVSGNKGTTVVLVEGCAMRGLFKVFPLERWMLTTVLRSGGRRLRIRRRYSSATIQ